MMNFRGHSINYRGGFTDGETYFVSDDSFITTEYSYFPDGKIQLNKDENTIISDGEHNTTTSKYEQNAWHQTGDYTFRKAKEKENYKVIKDY